MPTVAFTCIPVDCLPIWIWWCTGQFMGCYFRRCLSEFIMTSWDQCDATSAGTCKRNRVKSKAPLCSCVWLMFVAFWGAAERAENTFIFTANIKYVKLFYCSKYISNMFMATSQIDWSVKHIQDVSLIQHFREEFTQSVKHKLFKSELNTKSSWFNVNQWIWMSSTCSCVHKQKCAMIPLYTFIYWTCSSSCSSLQ